MISKILFGFLLATVTACGFLFWENKVLNANLTQMEAVYERQKSTILEMEKNFNRTLEENTKLQQNMMAQSAEVDKLRKTLIEHNLTKLAIEKPGLIEKSINDATTKTFNDIRSFTTPE